MKLKGIVSVQDIKPQTIDMNREAMRLFEKCINTNDLELGRKLIAETAAFKTPVSPTPLYGAEGYLSVVSLMRKSFPDVQWKLVDMVADEKTVAVYWECSGTFNGEAPFAGLQPNGRRFTTTVMNFYSFDSGGKICKDVAATGIAGILDMTARKFIKNICSVAGAMMLTGCVSCGVANQQTKEKCEESMFVVRIAEIEVYPEWLEAYLAAAGTVGAESVAKEPGVICIFPMQKKESPTSIRIVEIYRSEEAYKAHLATPHFRAYKEGTPHMIKSLKLVPMQPLDPAHADSIFKKWLQMQQAKWA